jgi:hypothetical protein
LPLDSLLAGHFMFKDTEACPFVVNRIMYVNIYPWKFGKFWNNYWSGRYQFSLYVERSTEYNQNISKIKMFFYSTRD